MSQENVDALRSLYDMWGKGKLGTGQDIFDADVQYIPLRHLPDAGRYHGPEALSEFMRRWLEPWTNITIAADELIEAENSVLAAVRMRGLDARAPHRWKCGSSPCGPSVAER